MECKEVFKSTMASINKNFDELRRAVSFFTNNTNSEGSIQLFKEIISRQVQMKRRLCRIMWKYLCSRSCSDLNVAVIRKAPECLYEETNDTVDSLFLSTSQRKLFERKHTEIMAY